MTRAEEATGAPRDDIREADPDASGGERDAAEPLAGAAPTRFAHASEAEMARILDFYQVRWEYEPTTFPILWNLDGDVVESFAPDFYLPDLEVFLEMTTLKQRLVRKKNRKLRRLRELYPGIRIKLFYARDFRAMMLKYGRLGLVESLSGTTGQVVPVRAAVVPVLAPEPVAPPEQIETEEPAALEDVIPVAAVAVDVATDAEIEIVDAPPTPAPARATLPASPRAKRRTRSGRRRRRVGLETQAGAEREAGA